MIARLSGTLVSKQPPTLVIDVNGVGYEVETPMSTFLALPGVGEDILLHTHLLVREDAQILFGFSSLAERSLFRLLLKISGVGAKMGLAILSTMSVSDFQRCVEYEDAAMLVRIPGVGKKRKAILLQHFGSIERLRRARAEELCRLPGISRRVAEAVLEELTSGG